MAFGAVGGMGPIYWTSAVVLGAVFVAMSVRLYLVRTTAMAMQLFAYSITYVTLLFSAMAIDQLVFH